MISIVKIIKKLFSPSHSNYNNDQTMDTFYTFETASTHPEPSYEPVSQPALLATTNPAKLPIGKRVKQKVARAISNFERVFGKKESRRAKERSSEVLNPLPPEPVIPTEPIVIDIPQRQETKPPVKPVVGLTKEDIQWVVDRLNEINEKKLEQQRQMVEYIMKINFVKPEPVRLIEPSKKQAKEPSQTNIILNAMVNDRPALIDMMSTISVSMKIK
jgi:hypothetical protein